MTPAPAIEIRNLSKNYGDIKALDEASIEVEAGTIFGLVGPNGSGKTTLIKAICGILKHEGDRVRVLGLAADRDRFTVRRRLGYMPQTPSLYEDLSPVENLQFFGGAFHLPDLDERVRRALEFVQLWERRDDPIHTFSGGMRQRASLACALLHDPELFILDEPTAGVDPTLKQGFWKHFRDLCDEGRTIFLSTNQMDEAVRCDRVAVIVRGRILISETPQAIRDRGKATVRITLAGGKTREAEVANYQEELPRMLAEFGLGDEVRRIGVSRQSLEDVILTLLEEAR